MRQSGLVTSSPMQDVAEGKRGRRKVVAAAAAVVALAAAALIVEAYQGANSSQQSFAQAGPRRASLRQPSNLQKLAKWSTLGT